MTFDERLAELGVDLSDLPSAYTLDAKRARGVSDIACRWFIDEDTPDGVALRNLVSIPLFQYILHLVDVIDRMETRLVNVIGEREYLLDRMWGENPCVICENANRKGGCAVDICEFEFAGVPEDWRAYDA